MYFHKIKHQFSHLIPLVVTKKADSQAGIARLKVIHRNAETQYHTNHRRVSTCASKSEYTADPDFSLTKRVFSESKKYRALNQVEEDICSYCSTLPDEGRDKCLSTLHTLRVEHAAATDGLSQEDQAVEADAKLRRLDDMARQLGPCGVKMTVDVLAHLQFKQAVARGEIEDKRRPVQRSETDENEGQREERLRDLFTAMDKQGKGSLNIAELREAMDVLGDHLDGAMVSGICDALDIHGSVTFDQFYTIVDAEAIRSHTSEALRLRALLHDTSHEHFKDWIRDLS